MTGSSGTIDTAVSTIVASSTTGGAVRSRTSSSQSPETKSKTPSTSSRETSVRSVPVQPR